MFFIEDSGIAYRIDEEEFGCSIRSYNLYIEGNETEEETALREIY